MPKHRKSYRQADLPGLATGLVEHRIGVNGDYFVARQPGRVEWRIVPHLTHKGKVQKFSLFRRDGQSFRLSRGTWGNGPGWREILKIVTGDQS